MDIKQLQAVVIDALEDIKAQDIKLYDTAHLTSMYERLAIASGTSNRQTKALAASVRDKVKEAGGQVIGMEGEETGEWVLVDLGDMIVHIMQAPIRAYYRLEEIWGDKELKLGAAKRTSKKADGEAPKKASRHLTSLQTVADAEPEVAPKKPRAPRKTAASTAQDDAVPAKKPRSRKPVGEADDSAEVAAPAKRSRKPAASKTEAKAEPKVAAGKTVKVAQPKAVVAELKELKEAKTRSRKKAEEAAAPAPVKRVLKRTTKKPAEE